MKQFLTELLLGDQSDHKEFRLSRLHAHEGGMISMSALFVMLGFFVLIGFLGNAGQAVFRKIETQNATDSMAHSTTVWMARHMNGITATNHLMGELTALMVLVEGLGGTEIDGNDEHCDQSAHWNDKIDDLKPDDFTKPVAITGDNIVGMYGLHNFEVQLIDHIKKITTKDGGDHDVCATVLDGLITIKRYFVLTLSTKQLVNVAQQVARLLSWYPPAKYIIEGVVAAAHIGLDAVLLELVKDWYLTKATEVVATVLSPLRSEYALPLVIQGISLYGDTLADSVHLRDVISKTLDRSKGEFRIADYQTFPLLRDIALPIQRESVPVKKQGANPPPSLSSRKPSERGAVKTLLDITKPIKDQIGIINSAIERINDALVFTSWDLMPNLEDATGGDFDRLNDENARGYGYETNPSLKDLKDYTKASELDWQEERKSQWVRASYPHVDELRRPFLDFFESYIPTSAMDAFFLHWTNRYTISVSHRVRNTSLLSSVSQGLQKLTLLRELRKELEKLRAKFQKFLNGVEDELTTVTDTLAELQSLSGILEQLADKAKISGLLKELGVDDVWFDLVKKHVSIADQIGSGSQPDGNLDVETADFQMVVKTIAWINYLGYLLDTLDNLLTRIENLLEFGPPHMYIMRDSTPDTKGNEPWATDSGRAEELFAIQMFVKRETPAAILTPPLYPNPNRHGVLALAESLVYNGNGRKVAEGAGNDPEIQPNTGWDTLNWTPAVKAPEWGLRESGAANRGDWFKPFTGGTEIAVDAPNHIRLNWQGKLVPIGSGRLQTALFAPDVKKFFNADGADSLMSNPDLILH